MPTPTEAEPVTVEPKYEAAADSLVVQPHALEMLQRAEIDIQIATAKKYARPELAVIRRKMLSFATLDEETATSCFYTLRRTDAKTNEKKLIQGPSVRLAEIAVACYGNLRAGSRIIDNDGRKIVSQGVCHDLENNVLITVEVGRRITNKEGRPFSDDMQIVAGNAANSIALRNAVFKVIPQALIKPVFEQAKRVAVGDAATLAKKRDVLFNKFAAMGVDAERVLAAVGKQSVQSVDLEDVTDLVGLGTAIQDGEMTIEEAFPAPGKEEPGAVKTSLKDKLKAQTGRKAPETPVEKPVESEEKS